MMGQYGSTGGWWPLVGMLVPLVFLLVLIGGGYLVFRGGARHTDLSQSRDGGTASGVRPWRSHGRRVRGPTRETRTIGVIVLRSL
jgi:hypothetical protein